MTCPLKNIEKTMLPPSFHQLPYPLSQTKTKKKKEKKRKEKPTKS